jgi:hypothetical protein
VGQCLRAVNQVLSPLDRLTYKRGSDATAAVFITGLPRSGYGRIPGRYSPAENHVLWEKWLRSNGALGHFVPSESIATAHAVTAREMLASTTALAGRTYVFKDVYLSLSPAALLQLYPCARIVFVTRSKDAVCESIYRARSAIGADRWWSIRPLFCRDDDRDIRSANLGPSGTYHDGCACCDTVDIDTSRENWPVNIRR